MRQNGRHASRCNSSVDPSGLRDLAGPGLLLAVFLAAAGCTDGVTVSGAWIRSLPGDLPAAGYFTMHNPGSRGATLVGASAADFEAVELHQSVERDGLQTMAPVDSVEIPGHGELEFRPGGYHLMLMRPRRPLAVGDTEPITLRFEDGSQLHVDFAVRTAAGEPG